MPLPDPVELVSPSILHLLALLIVLTVSAFRAEAVSLLRRWRFVLLVVTTWCWLAATPVFVNWLALELENQYSPVTVNETLPEDPVIVVLSAGPAYEQSLPDGLQLNLASYRRTQRAVELWQRTGGTLIFAGTTRMHEARAVSERMAALAVQFGIPLDAIRIEPDSTNTYENLRNSADMIVPGRKIMVVTSAIHMPRAMAVAEALDLDAIAVPADFRAKSDMTWRAWLPDTGTRPFLAAVLHEWLGLAWYALRGWA